jgi:hypothetical protein
MRKRIVYLAGVIGLTMSLYGCGGAADNTAPSPAADTKEEAQETEPESTETKEETQETEPESTETKEEAQKASEEATETTETDAPSYSDIYTGVIDELVASGDADLFALVDVDGDDTPELAAISSEGSWDKDQVFLYTTDGQGIVLLANDIGPGMEGHAIGFFEKQNVFMQSGATLGDRYVFNKIENGEPVQITAISSFTMIDENDNEVSTCLVDDNEVTNEEYTKALKEALPSGEITVLASVDTTDMVKYDVSAEDGYLSYTEKEKIPYNSYDEIMKILGSGN